MTHHHYVVHFTSISSLMFKTIYLAPGVLGESGEHESEAAPRSLSSATCLLAASLLRAENEQYCYSTGNHHVWTCVIFSFCLQSRYTSLYQSTAICGIQVKWLDCVTCCPLPPEPGYLNFILYSPRLVRLRGYEPVRFPATHLPPFVRMPGGHDDV